MEVIKVGDKVPNIDVFEDSPDKSINFAKFCANKLVVAFGVPGAFTPGCSKTHLPGFVSKAEDFKKKGADEVVCITVNDPFVTKAWSENHHAAGYVRIFADPKAALTAAMGLDVNLPPLGGVRSKRYAMVVKDGAVTQINVEPDNVGLTCSLAEQIILK